MSLAPGRSDVVETSWYLVIQLEALSFLRFSNSFIGTWRKPALKRSLSLCRAASQSRKSYFKAKNNFRWFKQELLVFWKIKISLLPFLNFHAWRWVEFYADFFTWCLESWGIFICLDYCNSSVVVELKTVRRESLNFQAAWNMLTG